MSPQRSPHRGRLAAAILVLASLLAACGSGGTAASGPAASDEDLERYQQRLEEVYEGTFEEPTGPPVEVPTDKKIWVVSYGQGSDGVNNAADAVQEVATTFGWDLTIFDGKFNPGRWLEGMQQAVVADADAIITLYLDCAAIKNGLQQADDAGIPVVSVDGYDCDPGLYDHLVEYAGHQSKDEFLQEWGGAQAAWVIAKTEGKANVLVANGQDLESVIAAEKGQLAELEKCPGCTVTSLKFTGADLGQSLQQKVSQELLKNPDINSFIGGYDAILTLGGAQAVKSSGRDLFVMGGEGSAPGLQLIREDGGMDACAGQPTPWSSYAGMDAVARLLVGQDPAEVDTGIGYQVCDADHNLSSDGEPFIPRVDYKAGFMKLWGKG